MFIYIFLFLEKKVNVAERREEIGKEVMVER